MLLTSRQRQINSVPSDVKRSGIHLATWPHDRLMATLHVTARAGDHGKVEELQVVARQGPSAPSALAPARTAAHSDLGTGRSLAGLRCRGASAVAGRRPEPTREGGSRLR